MLIQPPKKDLVDGDIFGSNRGREGEDAQRLQNDAWEPAPYEGAGKDDAEEPVPADTPVIGGPWVGLGVVMQPVHEGRIHEILGPDHVGGRDQPGPDNAG